MKPVKHPILSDPKLLNDGDHLVRELLERRLEAHIVERGRGEVVLECNGIAGIGWLRQNLRALHQQKRCHCRH